MLGALFFVCIFTSGIVIEELVGAEDPLNVDKLPLQDYNYEVNDAPVIKSQSYKEIFKTLKKYNKEVITKASNILAYKGSCSSRPGVPINGNLSCSNNSGCRAVCFDGHRFPHGEHELAIVCREKQWKIQGADYNAVPDCQPICSPECKNNGICIAPNQCICSENFSGPQCQFENKPCLNYPKMVLNAQQKCNSKTCTITCLNRFVFPDGSSVANLECKHGNWEPTKKDWVTIPDCLPVCNPPCQNGGICRSLDTCQCPTDYRGPQCQYHVNVCSTDKLAFNGGLHCNTPDQHSYECILNCPAGVDFEFPPAAKYVCRYDKGVFEPQPIPQCQPPEGGRLVLKEKATYYKTMNTSWLMQGSTSYNVSKSSSYKYGYQSGTFNGAEGLEGSSGSSSMIESEGGAVGGSLNGYGKVERIEVKVEPGSCFTWGGVHYKTLDGQIYSFESSCAYTLIKDTRDGLFTVTAQNDPHCNGTRCSRLVRIFIQGKEYRLGQNSAGLPEFRNAKKALPVPSQLAHLRIESANGGQFLVASIDSVGLKIKWDGTSLVQINAAESLWNRTAGLCGNMNGVREDDLGSGMKSALHLANTWKVDEIGEKCEEYPSHQSPCAKNSELGKEAEEFCRKLLSDTRYKSCAKSVDFSGIEATCRWDYCSCEYADKRKCACETMGVYVRQCAHKGIVSLAGWRDNSVCPMECSKGKIYMSCGPQSQTSCGAEMLTPRIGENDADCEEGCFCPSGTVLNEGRCIPPEECPCRLRGKSFEPGASVVKDCNTCACAAGKWTCTETKCNSRCSAVGDPHYTTFDGKRYDFMGKCSYYLVKGDDYSIEAENAPCTSAISEMMGFTRTFDDGEPSCTKTVTIRVNDVAIKLKQNRQILVNGEDVTKLPMLAGGAKMRIVSSIFIGVALPNGLEVLWDGVSRVYINAPAHFRGKTKGLCGTFSSNQKNDFLTPDGDVEQAVVSFANKWKTNEQCADVKKDFDHPCELNPQKRAAAEKYCSVLKKNLFSGCHWHVDPEPFYKDCIFDMCACEANIETCLCPTLSAYAKDCAQLGVVVPWRQEVKECRVHCPGDQEYQMCGNSCTRSCTDISFNDDCKEECVEGCNCPKGYTLNNNGECIPISQCPCAYGEIEFLAGYKEVRPGRKGQELCTCAGAKWRCSLATPDEVQDYPAITQLKSLCSATKHQEVTTCEPVEQRTCRNMHQLVIQTPAICRPGCICKPGYVLDLPSGECVQEEKCPCYHGGQSYPEGSTMQEECNTCQCNGGKWNCTDIICPGICSVWGDSHYKTFDDRQFDFQGVCDYVFAKGKLSEDECFDVSIRNVACGTTGVTCSKSITLTVGKTNSVAQESVTLTRGKSLTEESFRGLGRIAVRRAGLFIFLDVPDLGLVLQWDEGTRVYVRLDAKWKGRTKGLCGDFNDNAEDDFKTPSGGVSEASANLFADSWKMNDLCAGPQEDQPDTCAKHPERKLWASQRCRTMKSRLFEPCHSEVSPEPYIERCVYDACGCDDGGDCECLCTAIAAYTQECNARGVPIQWRSQKLCPMQCDETCSTYSPCVSTCPRETCDNLVTRSDSMHLCDQDTCVEGCQPKICPEGHIYLNSSYSECVPRADCKTLCKVIDGVKYYEGDKVKGDECHSCFCSRGKVICKGSPCVSTTIATTVTSIYTTPNQKDEEAKCKSGWTEWVNKDLPMERGFRSDIEELIEILGSEGSASCDRDKMVDIQCRTADTKKSYKESGYNVECSLQNGLICYPTRALNQTCPDFEVRVLCECEIATTTTPIPIVDKCYLTDRYQASPTNCYEFYQCGPGLLGNEWVKKTCGKDMMFNEKQQICDWPANVVVTRPECAGTTSTTHIPVTTEAPCKAGERWSDCAIQCSRTCSYYNYVLTKNGICDKVTDCVPGCVPLARTECLNNNYLWKDEYTCVDRSVCNCKDDNGRSAPPDAIITVSDCKRCQCIDNFYTCDESSCKKEININTHSEKIIEKHDEIVVLSTVSPPRKCADENLIWLMEQSSLDVTLMASSYESDFITPDTIRLRRMGTMQTWRPLNSDNQQWVEVRFEKPKPIYGIIVGGDAFEDKFVTSYQVKFSEDGHIFSIVTEIGENGKTVPKALKGPIDSLKPVMEFFNPPFEAKVVKIIPLTWHDGIAMQVELIGCEGAQTTTTTPAPIIPTTVTTIHEISPVCDDKMGYDSGLMSDQQVSVSSSYSNKVTPNLRLSSLEMWRPQLDNPNQYVQFDFLEQRNLTGIETKGGNGIWTIAYKVFYSNDGKHWNPIIDDNGAEKEFHGNVDDYTNNVNYFKRPIAAKLLRIFPTRWHGHIGLKVEIRGCFIPYPLVSAIYIPPPPPSNCNVCNGVAEENTGNCKCADPLWWDGRYCVAKLECSCIVGHVTYPIGSSYETPDCNHCVCALGGLPVCERKVCEPCPTDLRPVLTDLCGCMCMPCPAGQILCPTSKDCIDQSAWCNGIDDCTDDEVDCAVVVNNTIKTTVKKKTTIELECVTNCPPGYIMVNENENESYDGDSYVNTKFSMEKTETMKMSYSQQIIINKPASPVFHSRFKDTEEKHCPQLICKPKVGKETRKSCTKTVCPKGFQPKYDQSNSYRKTNICDNSCVPIPFKKRVCNLVGRTFTTFDDLEFKYEICNHFLARDRDDNRWYIIAEKVCKDKDLSCLKTLTVIIGDHIVVLHPDMYAIIDGNMYSASEVKRFGNEHPAMKLSRVGNALRLESVKYPFWALIESSGIIKVGVSEELAGHVDGLCGFLDGDSTNDQQTPQGLPTLSTQEFGDSWRVSDSAECKLQHCPKELQDQAWKMCTLVKDSSFDACSHTDRDKFVSSCLETSCACLAAGNSTSQECGCKTLAFFVAECLATNRNADLSTWRSVHNCPAMCDAPFVHKDCFRYKCERSCENLQSIDPCPMMDDLCVPGCFCPDGMVRHGDTCVPPSECRDCVCDGLGSSKYVTFDRSNILFNGNCTYVLSRDVIESIKGNKEQHTYEIFVSNGPCDEGVCTEAITVIYQKHIVQIRKGDLPNQLVSFVDERKVDKYPYTTSWLNLEETPSRDISLLIPEIQLEIVSYKNNFAFMLRLPSHTFGGSMEGLCGDCDGRKHNDLTKQDGKLAKDVQEFGNSWLVKDLPPSLNLNDEHCGSTPKKLCSDGPSANNYCERVLQSESFARCHGLVNPMPYYLACKDTMCNGGNPCSNFEAYARMCSVAGICIDWRTWELCPYYCQPHMEYRACNPGCLESCESLNNGLTLDKCTASPIEGCFCPMDQVYHNNSCIPKRNCFICDNEGHVEGDVWQPNKCTTCSCEKRLVKCQEMNCPALQTVCQENSKPVMVHGTETDCCPKYICVTVTTEAPSCVETQQPACGFGQTLKITTDSNGCQKFMCQCVPENECYLLENDINLDAELLEPGFIKVTNTSGCCPRTSKICSPETCPPSVNCQKYHNAVFKEVPNACCPQVECEPPKDLCLYYMDSSNELTSDENLIAKKIGEIWEDGKCKTCTCVLKDGKPNSRCTVRECLDIHVHPDVKNYMLEKVVLDNQCCPNYERVACKDDEHLYQVGDKWHPNHNDVCVTTMCSTDINGVNKKTIVQECAEVCELGYEYRPSADKSIACCGECVPVACTVNGQLRNIGETWWSEDYCTKSTCLLTNKTIHVHVERETCEDLSPIEQHYVLEKERINDKCCPLIKKKACLSNGESYKPGDTWESENCVLNSCRETDTGDLIKSVEIKTCNTDCPKGWEYQQPEFGKCCGQCKQTYCVIKDILYEPGKTWYSNDNCTSYSCIQKEDQLLVSMSSSVCPELDCAPELMYDDGCCKRCNITTVNKEVCAAEVIDFKKTIGMVVEKKGIHGLCKNLKPIDGLTECHGYCDSSTHLDPKTWSQISDCKCCKPTDEYRKITVELICEDGKKFKKILTVPTRCTCETCSDNAESIWKPQHELKSYVKNPKT